LIFSESSIFLHYFYQNKLLIISMLHTTAPCSLFLASVEKIKPLYERQFVLQKRDEHPFLTGFYLPI